MVYHGIYQYVAIYCAVTLLYFLTNFILSYASVYRQLYDGHCPEYTCQLSKDTELPGVMLVYMSRCTVAMSIRSEVSFQSAPPRKL